MKEQIKTELIIDAPIAAVWKELTHFEAYPQWNPFVKSLTGNVKEGGKIKIELPGMNFKPKVLKFEANKAFVWKGKLGLRGIFDGTHQFYLESISADQTRFIHQEDFSGILVGWFMKNKAVETKAGFESMNNALKYRVEQAVH